MGNSRYVFYCVTFSVATFLALSGTASAELYQYTDADGVTHLTDDPQQVPPKLRDKSRRESDVPVPEPKQGSFFDSVRPDSRSQYSEISPHMKQPKRAKVIRQMGVPPQDAAPIVSGMAPQRIPDRRLATPESAILFFRLAVREFSMHDIEACTTPEYWQYASTRFATMGSGALQGAENRIFSIEKTAQNPVRAEFSVIVVEALGKEVRYVMTVENINGEWRISNF